MQGTAHICGLPYCAYIQVFGDTLRVCTVGSPLFITRKRIAIMKKTNVTKLFTLLLVGIAFIVVIYYILYFYNA